MVGPGGFYSINATTAENVPSMSHAYSFEGFVVWFIILVGGIFLGGVHVKQVVTLSRKLFCFIFSAVDRKSSHAYVEDGNMELQQFDKYGYYFYHLSTACTSLVLVISD